MTCNPYSLFKIEQLNNLFYRVLWCMDQIKCEGW